jgi:hypothetical protein
MKKTLLDRLFGIEKIPAAVRSPSDGEGVVLAHEGWRRPRANFSTV